MEGASVPGLEMNTVSVLILVSLMTITLFYIFQRLYENFTGSNKHTNQIPGPKGWPILGCLPYLAGKDARKVLARLNLKNTKQSLI